MGCNAYICSISNRLNGAKMAKPLHIDGDNILHLCFNIDFYEDQKLAVPAQLVEVVQLILTNGNKTSHGIPLTDSIFSLTCQMNYYLQ